MLKKIIDNLGFAGTLLLLAGLIHYSIFKEWELLNQIPVYAGLAAMAAFLILKLPAIVSALGSRSGRQGSAAGLGLLLFLGILALANFLNYRHHRRFDLSEGNMNSLSEQTLQVVSNLKKDVKVAAFFEDKNSARQFTTAIDEYKFASPRIDYAVYDPRRDRSAVTEYQAEFDGQIIVRSADKTQKIDSYSEEKLTNAIIKVTRDKEKTVVFLTGHGEHKLDDNGAEGYQAVKGAVERQNYKVSTLNLAAEGKIPEDASVLISAGPKSAFLPNEVELLDQYLANGGKFLLLVDPRAGFEMNDWLAKYGIAFDDNEVVDVSGLGAFFGLGEGAPVVRSYTSHPITAKMEVVTFFPLARSVGTVDSSLGYKTETLFSSSAQSWGETEPGETVQYEEDKDKRGPLALALAATLDHGDQSVAGDVDEEAEPSEGKKQTRIVAVGDSDFVANRFISIGGGHSDLFLNMVSWLSQDEDLIAVRPKAPTDRKVTLTQAGEKIFFWGSVVLLPAAILGLGLMVWWRRR